MKKKRRKEKTFEKRTNKPSFFHCYDLCAQAASSLPTKIIPERHEKQ
jgi:hypothetical protein